MSIGYNITLHVKPVGSLGSAEAVQLLEVQSYVYALSLNDTVATPGPSAPDYKDQQNALLKDKLYALFDQVPSEYKQAGADPAALFRLTPAPDYTRPSGDVWDPDLSGVVAQIEEPDPQSVTVPPAYQPVIRYFGGQTVEFFIGIYPDEVVSPIVTTTMESNDEGAATGLQVIYHPTRTTIQNVRVQVRPAEDVDDEPQLRVLDHRFVEVRWERGLPQGRVVTVQVTHSGEPLVKDFHRWIIDPEDEASWDRGNAIIDSHDLAKNPFADQPSISDIFEKRHAILEGQSEDDKTRYQRFFNELDFVSAGPDVSEALKDQFHVLGEVLKKRTLWRGIVEESAGGQIPAPTDVNSKAVNEASKLVAGLIETHFSSNNALDIPDIESAFQRFAMGGLWFGEPGDQPHSTSWGVPNSANFLHFAELALTAIEIGDPKANLWEKLLYVFVRSAKLYVDTYYLNGSWQLYNFKNYDSKPQPSANKAGAANAYPSSMSIGQARKKFAALVSGAFSDDLN